MSYYEKKPTESDREFAQRLAMTARLEALQLAIRYCSEDTSRDLDETFHKFLGWLDSSQVTADAT